MYSESACVLGIWRMVVEVEVPRSGRDESEILPHLLFRAGRRQAGDRGPGLCSRRQVVGRQAVSGMSGTDKLFGSRPSLSAVQTGDLPSCPGPALTEMPA
jgi:hypothetical protein